jgi:hypothetical protein
MVQLGVGIRPQCSKRQAGSRRPASRREVAFEPVDGVILDRIDEAYRAKYRGSPYLSPMINVGARAATVKLIPLDTDAGKEAS